MNNRSYMSNLLVNKLLCKAADFTGAKMEGFPITIANRNGERSFYPRGLITRKISTNRIVGYNISLPSLKALRSTKALHNREDYLRKLSERIFITIVHECQHVADAQNNLFFTKRSAYGRRPNWENRPEEIRAQNAEKKAIESGLTKDEIVNLIYNVLINSLTNRSNKMTKAQKRAVKMLKVAARFIEENDFLESYIIFYDGADCDGGCLREDLLSAAEDLE
jgi:hypothetical protein